MSTSIIFSLLGWVVLALNLYAIYKVWKANVFSKWWKILLPILVNLPTLTYSAAQGVGFQLLNFLLFGKGVAQNYQSNPFEPVIAGETISFALPLGALYVFYKLDNWVRTKEYAEEGV
ncbi:hypothetical protein [Spirosoma jeollabukense]